MVILSEVGQHLISFPMIKPYNLNRDNNIKSQNYYP